MFKNTGSGYTAWRGIGSLELILGLLISLKIRAQSLPRLGTKARLSYRFKYDDLKNRKKVELS